MWPLIYVYILVFSFILSNIFVGLCKRLAVNFGIMDKPDANRKIHQHPVPLLGGVGMFFAFTLTLIINIFLFFLLRKSDLLFFATLNAHFAGIKSVLPKLTIILVTSLSIVALGIFDDLKKLSAWAKLSVQVLVALIVFGSGIKITLFIHNTFLNGLLSVCWIVGITNAFNLLDNMDGLSCGTAIISSLIFFIVAYSNNQFFVSTILVAFLGVLLGFLKYNFPPAQIFMGDAGSLFIGFILSLLTILNTYYTNANPTIAPVIMPLLILAIPIFDTFSVICIRLRNKVSIFTADKNHFSHRLLGLGMSKKEAVLFIYLANFCIGLGALLLNSLDIKGCLIVFLQAVCMLTLIVLLEKIKKCSN